MESAIATAKALAFAKAQASAKAFYISCEMSEYAIAFAIAMAFASKIFITAVDFPGRRFPRFLGKAKVEP